MRTPLWSRKHCSKLQGHTHIILTLFHSVVSSMRLLARERTCSFLSESRFPTVLILLWARLRSLRWTSVSRPDIRSMLLKERSNHSSWVSVARAFAGISSMMLLSSWSLRRLVNCQRFSMQRISVEDGKRLSLSLFYTLILSLHVHTHTHTLWKSSLRDVTSTKSIPSIFASRPASPSGPCSTMHWRSSASLITFGSIVSYKWLIFVFLSFTTWTCTTELQTSLWQRPSSKVICWPRPHTV